MIPFWGGKQWHTVQTPTVYFVSAVSSRSHDLENLLQLAKKLEVNAHDWQACPLDLPSRWPSSFPWWSSLPWLDLSHTSKLQATLTMPCTTKEECTWWVYLVIHSLWLIKIVKLIQCLDVIIVNTDIRSTCCSVWFAELSGRVRWHRKFWRRNLTFHSPENILIYLVGIWILQESTPTYRIVFMVAEMA